FGVSAADLDPRQAVLLAAVIINPRRYSPVDPGRRIARRVRLIAARLRRRGDLDDEAYRVAIAAPLPPTPAPPPPLPPGAAVTDSVPAAPAPASPDSGSAPDSLATPSGP
ncbi:MAG TPA: hypothetical protein VI792_07880, partial [Candidatus Eisenbacteria bacterium]